MVMQQLLITHCTLARPGSTVYCSVLCLQTMAVLMHLASLYAMAVTCVDCQPSSHNLTPNAHLEACCQPLSAVDVIHLPLAFIAEHLIRLLQPRKRLLGLVTQIIAGVLVWVEHLQQQQPRMLSVLVARLLLRADAAVHTSSLALPIPMRVHGRS